VKMSKETPKRLEYELSCVIYIPFYRKTVKFREIKIQLGKKNNIYTTLKGSIPLGECPTSYPGSHFS